MSGEHVFAPVAFRAQFPAFASTTKYPDEQLSGYFTMASVFIYPIDWCALSGDTMQLALNLLTAHLAQINAATLRGNTATGIVTGASIDKVSVSLQAPATTSAWQAWLATTPYGMQLWALFSARKGCLRGVVGGNAEREAFRRVGGGFGGPSRWLR